MMLKIVKYDIRSSFYPFATLIGLNIIFFIVSILGFNSKGLLDIFNSINGLGLFLLIIYGIREFYKDFCTDKNVLMLSIPKDIFIRFLSKVLAFSASFILLQITRLIFNISNPLSNYNHLKTVVENYKGYIVYDFIGVTLFCISTTIVIAFGVILANSISKNKDITSVFIVIIVFALFLSSNIIYQKVTEGFQQMIYNANNVEDKFKLDVKFTVKSEALKNFNINTNIYLPLSYGSRGGSSVQFQVIEHLL